MIQNIDHQTPSRECQTPFAIDASNRGLKASFHLKLGQTALLSFALTALVSCSQIPNLKPDDWQPSQGWKEAKKDPSSSSPSPSDAVQASSQASSAKPPVTLHSNFAADPKIADLLAVLPKDPWWEEVGDPTLNQLEEMLFKGNVSVRQLSAQVRVTQAALRQAEAAYSPTLNLNTSATRARNQLGVPAGTSYSLSSPLSWELDVWGRIGAQTSVANFNSQVTLQNFYQAARSAQVLLAQSYFTLRAQDLDLRMLEDAERAYAKSLALTQAKYRQGVVSSSDVAQAQTQLSTTQAQRKDLAIQRAQTEHQLAALLGVVPADLAIEPLTRGQIRTLKSSISNLGTNGLAWPPQVPELPEIVSLDVLARRPDIQAAKASVNAANANVGVANAAFLPPLVLQASAGYRNTSIASLVNPANQAWSMGPGLVLPLLDGGLRQAAKDNAVAALEAQVMNYRQVVITAFQEVEDNLVAASLLKSEVDSLRQAHESSLKNLQVVQAQYKAGTVAYLNVVTAQTQALSAERSWVDAQTRSWLAWAVLRKNLFQMPEDQRAR